MLVAAVAEGRSTLRENNFNNFVAFIFFDGLLCVCVCDMSIEVLQQLAALITLTD